MSFNQPSVPAWLQQPPSRVFTTVSWVSIVLLAIAYISHLGVIPVDPRTDEARRALVTLEMINSGNYIVPTLNGEPFLNKPPLYNWILAFFYRLMGVNPFALRLPVILFTFFYGWLIWIFTRRYTNTRIALVTTLFFLTNGRILIYDSLQGLIDVGFSSLVFLCFMWVYQYGKKEKYWHLFLLTYLVVAVSFLMKGLPALVFHAFSLLGFFILEKRFKVLFSAAHFAGIGLFMTLVGGYYYLYFQKTNISLEQMFGNMLEENTKRTVVAADSSLAIRHFLTYPFSLIYHFAPWALLMLMLVRKKIGRVLSQNNFIFYCSVIFVPGFIIYWFSPNIDTAARYFFMLLPLFYVVLVYLYHHSSTAPWQRMVFDYTIMGIFGLAAAGLVVVPFVKQVAHLPALWPKTIFLMLALGAIVWLAFKQASNRLAWLVLALVVVRVGFNWFVVENRGGYQRRHIAYFEKMMELTNERPLAIEKQAYTGNTDGISYLYMLRTGRILPVATQTEPGHCYITADTSAAKYPHTLLYRWEGHLAPDLWLVERR